MLHTLELKVQLSTEIRDHLFIQFDHPHDKIDYE